jgi:hypothetical protein
LQQAVHDYPDIVVPAQCSQALDEVRQKYQQLKMQYENNDDAQQFIIAAAQTLAAAKEAADACH